MIRQAIIYQIHRLHCEEKSKKYEGKKKELEEKLSQHRVTLQQCADEVANLEEAYRKESSKHSVTIFPIF